MPDTMEVEITETLWQWGAPDEDLCSIPTCGGILRDHAVEYDGPLGLGVTYEYRQCGRCQHISGLVESRDEP